MSSSAKNDSDEETAYEDPSLNINPLVPTVSILTTAMLAVLYNYFPENESFCVSVWFKNASTSEGFTVSANLHHSNTVTEVIAKFLPSIVSSSIGQCTCDSGSSITIHWEEGNVKPDSLPLSSLPSRESSFLQIVVSNASENIGFDVT